MKTGSQKRMTTSHLLVLELVLVKMLVTGSPGFLPSDLQTRHAPYRLSWNIQAHDGLDTGLSEEAGMT